MPIGLKLTVDYAFKRVFGKENNKDLLISLINSVAFVNKDSKITDITILNPYNLKDYEEDKLSILDIKAVDNFDNIYDVEMQVIFEDDYIKRILYYASRLYCNQLKQGDDYSLLKPVISISFVDDIIFKNQVDYLNRFVLKNDKNNITLDETLVFYMIELPKFSLKINELSDNFNKWLYFIKNSSTFDRESVPEAFKEVCFMKAMEELQNITSLSKEYEMYERREKYMRDTLYLKNELERKYEKGISKGRIEGIKEGERKTAKSMLLKNFDYDTISEITGLSVDEIETLNQNN